MEKKKILLVGDSIKMGYVDYVRDALADVAEVYSPTENGRFAINVLRFIHDWKKTLQWPEDMDLIHWNAGLWDLINLYDDGPLTPLPFYEQAVARVDRRFRLLFPRAKLVFATTTSVIESERKPHIHRSNAVICEYNEAARRALAPTDTVINDLYATTIRFPDSYHSDAVHFYTPEATERIGGQVLATICHELDIVAGDVKLDGFAPERFLTNPDVGY